MGAISRELSVVEHLEDLRRRILISLLWVCIATLVSLPFSPAVLTILKLPAANIRTLVYFGPEEALAILVRISIFCGILCAFPAIAYQFWLFVSPAIQPRLKKYAVSFVFFCSLAFIAGGLFAYFLLLPRTLTFLLSLGGEDLQAMISAQRYVSFVVTIIAGCGLVFQMPVVIFLLTKLGIINARFLRKNFKFALASIVIIAAVITPTTDIFNLFLLAVPMLLLYEISIWISFFTALTKKKEQRRSYNE